ncbi:MAG TPA: tyrosine-type recombinase/integrase [Micromonosporaceae bacterium]
MQSSPCADLIDAFCEYHRIRGHSPRTLHHHRALLSRVDRELPAGLCATSDEIRAWLYRDTLAQNTRASYYSSLATFYRWAVGRPGGLSLNPMADLPAPAWRRGRPRPLRSWQLERILNAAVDPYRLWALLAVGLGARCIEISRLDRQDIDVDTTYLHGKGDRYRTVPTHPAVWDAVRGLPRGPIARTTTGVRANPRYISAMASRYFHDKLGLPVTMHHLRHTYGTLVQRATGDLRITQELLGHAKPETTALYTEVSGEAKAAAVARLALPV